MNDKMPKPDRLAGLTEWLKPYEIILYEKNDNHATRVALESLAACRVLVEKLKLHKTELWKRESALKKSEARKRALLEKYQWIYDCELRTFTCLGCNVVVLREFADDIGRDKALVCKPDCALAAELEGGE